MRETSVSRKTAETDIQLKLNLDGMGASTIHTGCGFLDHMLTLLAFHGRFDLTVSCKGDTQVDDHHTVEDVGIALGRAFSEALGDRAGITRYGSFYLPMDEALVLCALDISGRAHLEYALTVPSQKIGTFDTELAREFFLAVVRELKLTLHLRQLSGLNSHHILEAAFKGFGRAMKQAVAIDPDARGGAASTKGVLL
jgi:imidazoleglycerol-phosphate dehydratase